MIYMKNNSNNNAPKSLENIRCDIIRDNMRMVHPDKSDKELGIDKPFFHENVYTVYQKSIYGIFNFVKRIFK